MAKRKHLTDTAVARLARPVTGRTEIKDTEPGLSLRITPNGVKSWSVVYRVAPDNDPNGHRTQKKRKVVGYYPTMGVAEARVIARRMASLASDGHDPVVKDEEDRVAKARETAEQAAGTFEAVAGSWVATMEAGARISGRKRPVTADTAAGRKSLLERKVLPALGDKPLAEITPLMVNRLLTSVEAENGPVDNTLKVVRGVFNFAATRGLFTGLPPTAGLTPRQAPVKETRALSEDELRTVWAAAGRVGWPYGALVRALMLTGQRRREIAGLRWDEVDFDRKLLIIPAERVKNRAGAHEVPITAPLEAILREAEANCAALKRQDDSADTAAREKKSGLVFPSATTGEQLCGWRGLKQSLDREIRAELAGLNEDDRRALRAGGALRAETRARKADAAARISATELKPWRLHDLRHTFITRCRDGEENAEGEIIWSAPLDVLQAAVNHEITAGVTARYDHGDLQRRYRLRKRELMEWWSRKLLTIVEGAPGDNVVPLHMAR